MTDKIAEIIESTTTGYIAECYELYCLPTFGAMVKTIDGQTVIFGVVSQAGTSSIEPGRRPVARGKDEPTEEAVYESSPQLLKLLRSEFSVLTVGHAVDGKIFQYLPPKPARIHAFVHPCTSDEVKGFGQSFEFLSLLVNESDRVPPEELVAAVLRELSRVQDNPRGFLVAAGKALTAIMGKDYQRLKATLERMRS
jgi:hypothetical protein